MADCCSAGGKSLPPGKRNCPISGHPGTEVSIRTIIHHLMQPWTWAETGRRYYFCEDPVCDVVYFGDDDSLIRTANLRTTVGLKQKADSALACYCFGVTWGDAKDPSIRCYILHKTRAGLCSCETSNPSGRCCLKDFPRD
ncbi:putative iron-sulfur cluster-binding metallochaperone [Thiohalomonas denitrificans]|uniref:putative iron-sulfur cluster-binding metallochaperone n=1 Tax=Thiohalomonas denitrificans TaxID=415747 RepID=UPI0026F16BD8|nr:hypothetical protein [Thiohalomonas denitrificans]